MATSMVRGAPALRRIKCMLFAFYLVGALQSTGVQTAIGQNIVRIEEDWELVIREPDPSSEAPQVTCVISPFGHVNAVYSVFDLNLRHLPDYAAGGMQLQVWNGTDSLSSSSSNRGVLLQVPGETVSWTQVMKMQEGKLTFQVMNGVSQTWGGFGGGERLLVSRNTDLENLNEYDSANSVANSGIGYSGHRVTSLILKKVRAYTESGDYVEDKTAKVVHQHQ